MFIQIELWPLITSIDTDFIFLIMEGNLFEKQIVNCILYSDLHVQITSSIYYASTNIALQEARHLQAFN